MRLIDIEPVVTGWKNGSEKIRKDAQELKKVKTLEAQDKAVIMEGLADIMENLTNQLLAAPVKRKALRAEWVPVDPESDVEWKCSNCWCVISTGWNGFEDADFNYCPCCGAMMGGADK